MVMIYNANAMEYKKSKKRQTLGNKTENAIFTPTLPAQQNRLNLLKNSELKDFYQSNAIFLKMKMLSNDK